MFRFHIHSRICHFHFNFIEKLNEGYTGMTIQVTLCPRPSIINAHPPPEQEAGLVGLPRFVCPLPEIVVTHKLTRPTRRSTLRHAMHLRMIGTYTAIFRMRLHAVRRSSARQLGLCRQKTFLQQATINPYRTNVANRVSS